MFWRAADIHVSSPDKTPHLLLFFFPAAEEELLTTMLRNLLSARRISRNWRVNLNLLVHSSILFPSYQAPLKTLKHNHSLGEISVDN